MADAGSRIRSRSLEVRSGDDSSESRLVRTPRNSPDAPRPSAASPLRFDYSRVRPSEPDKPASRPFTQASRRSSTFSPIGTPIRGASASSRSKTPKGRFSMGKSPSGSLADSIQLRVRSFTFRILRLDLSSYRHPPAFRVRSIHRAVRQSCMNQRSARIDFLPPRVVPFQCDVIANPRSPDRR